jgi:hypothetical protein
LSLVWLASRNVYLRRFYDILHVSFENFAENVKRREHLEDLDIDGNIILRCTLKKKYNMDV